MVKICKNCSKIIETHQTKNTRGRDGKFCSLECMIENKDIKHLRIKRKRKPSQKIVPRIFKHKTLDITLEVPDNQFGKSRPSRQFLKCAIIKDDTRHKHI